MKKCFLPCILGVVLLSPAVVSAHALSPTYYPLGPIPFILPFWIWLLIPLLPIVILIETLIVQIWAHKLGFKTNLKRVFLLYLVARAGELLSFIIIDTFAPGWPPAAGEALGQATFCLIMGLIPKLIFALYLYKKADIRTPRIVTAVCLATLIGYCAGIGWSYLAIAIR